jgi:hypothetical protein
MRLSGLGVLMRDGFADHLAFARAHFVPAGAGRSSLSDQLRITFSWKARGILRARALYQNIIRDVLPPARVQKMSNELLECKTAITV